MPTTKAIRRRIASVQSTQQITRAMKLVAASRLRRAQETLNNSRPYSVALTRVADSVLLAERSALGPAQGAKNVALIVAVASDRGLCGAYNASMLRFAEEQVREIGRNGLQARFIAVGRKTVEHFRRTKVPLIAERLGNQPLANLKLARDLARQMLTAYQSGEAREVGIVYSHFRSAISQRPTYERLLPVSDDGDRKSSEANEPPREGRGRGKEQGVSASGTYYLIEPSREELIPTVLRAYAEASIFHALAEAEASEQGARMTAMDSATNNAKEMISRLTLEMNRARQQQITRELMDIVGGAEALRG